MKCDSEWRKDRVKRAQALIDLIRHEHNCTVRLSWEMFRAIYVEHRFMWE